MKIFTWFKFWKLTNLQICSNVNFLQDSNFALHTNLFYTYLHSINAILHIFAQCTHIRHTSMTLYCVKEMSNWNQSIFRWSGTNWNRELVQYFRCNSIHCHFFAWKGVLKNQWISLMILQLKNLKKNVLKSKQNLHKYNKICKIIGTMKDAIIVSERS